MTASNSDEPRPRGPIWLTIRVLLVGLPLSVLLFLVISLIFHTQMSPPSSLNPWSWRVRIAAMIGAAPTIIMIGFAFAIDLIVRVMHWSDRRSLVSATIQDELGNARPLFQCRRCGLASPIPEYFGQSALQVRPGRLCPACQVKDATLLRQCLLGIWLALLGFGMVSLLVPGWRPAMIALAIAIVVLLVQILIVPHELGHALMAKLLGLPVFKVTVGHGPAILNRKIAGFRVVVGLYGGGGLTHYGFRSLERIRLKRFLVTLAGPLVDGLGLALVLCIAMMADLPWGVIGLLAIPHGLLLFGSLAPHVMMTDIGPVGSDGLTLLMTPFASEATVRNWHAGSYYWQACYAAIDNQFERSLQACEEGLRLYPDDLPLQFALPLAVLWNQDFSRARTLGLAALEKAGALHPLRPMLLTLVADADLLAEDNPAQFAEAKAFAAEALNLAPWAPQPQYTFGCASVMVNDGEDGVKVLQEVLPRLEPSSQSWPLCFLALAAARNGDRDQCQQYLDQARKLDPLCLAIAPTEKRVSATYSLPIT